MASKRMFGKNIIETDNFMDMPMPTKALYFLLGMEADDEGFVSPKRVMRIYGGNEDDLKVLVAKGFVIQFESGVIVITDWLENNYLDKNRLKETKFQAEKALLACSSNKYQLLNNCLTNVKPVEIRLDEIRLDEKVSPKSETLYEKPPKETFKTKRKIFEGRGQKYTPRTMSEKQQLAVDAFQGVLDYFKEKGYEDHGMQFFKVQDESRNKAVRKLAIRMLETLENVKECRNMIDWWFSGEGAWAEYEPEKCFMSKTIEKYLNREKTHKQLF